jgi:hypothetical protein
MLPHMLYYVYLNVMEVDERCEGRQRGSGVNRGEISSSLGTNGEKPPKTNNPSSRWSRLIKVTRLEAIV